MPISIAKSLVPSLPARSSLPQFPSPLAQASGPDEEPDLDHDHDYDQSKGEDGDGESEDDTGDFSWTKAADADVDAEARDGALAARESTSVFGGESRH